MKRLGGYSGLVGLVVLAACSSPVPQQQGLDYTPVPWEDPGLGAMSAKLQGNVYLSDLAWTQASNGWGPPELDKNVGGPKLGGESRIIVNGKTYAKGLGTHSNADIRYVLDGSCSVFSAEIGIDDRVDYTEPGGKVIPFGSVVFQVFADGTKIFDSGLVKGDSPTQIFNLDIGKKRELRLVVNDGGDGKLHDWADWGQAKLHCDPATLPSNPSGFAVGTVTSSSLELRWNPVEGATGYALERRTDSTVFAPLVTIATTSYTDLNLQPSTRYTYRLKAVNAAGSSSGAELSASTSATPPTSGQTPFGNAGNPWPLPGRIEFEHFDEGGPTVAYLDNEPANLGGDLYRTGGVDLSGAGGWHCVSYVVAGEWLEQTVNVAQAGSYTFKVRVGNFQVGAKIHLEAGGKDVSGPIEIPGAGNWADLNVVTKTGVRLEAGVQVLRVVFDTAAPNGAVGNFDYFELSLDAAALPAPTDLQISATAATVSNLSWTAVAGATGYLLERKTTGEFAEIARPTQPRFVDSDLRPNTRYTYRLRAAGGASSEQAVTTGSQLRVLFIGNSVTDYFGMTDTVRAMAQAETYPLYKDTHIVYGATLEGHWNGPDAQNKIRSGAWDVVMLQDLTTQPFQNPTAFRDYVTRFDGLIKEKGAKTLLFQIYQRRDFPGSQSQIVSNTYATADAINSAVAPLGTAWANVRQQYASLEIYADDYHPNATGSYLIAATVFSSLYGKVAPQAGSLEATTQDNLRQQAWSAVQALNMRYRLPDYVAAGGG
jgi:hypothetical protein